MKNTKRVALFDPYLDTLGGGEKHILSILTVFSDLEYEIEVLWDDNEIINKLKSSFGLPLKNFSVVTNFLYQSSKLKKVSKTAEYDFLFYVTNGSYFFSRAKKNYVFAMVPKQNLYQRNLINKLKLKNFRFIANSKFTKQWLKKWGLNSSVIYPYIDDSFFKLSTFDKDKLILSVGRFFPHLHSKKQEVIIDTFVKLKNQNKNLSDFKLCLVGRYKKEDENYINKLQESIKNRNDIIIKTNAAQSELIDLYKKASFYWHFTGFEVDESDNPEKVEHLGIAPLEAMASGNIVFAYGAGGINEIIKDGKNGFAFLSQSELIKKVNSIIINGEKRKTISRDAFDFVKENFSHPVFKSRVISYFSL